MTVLNDIQLTKNFKLSEFMCRAPEGVEGHDEVMLDMDLVTRLQTLRKLIEKPITIAAGYRSPAHNRAVGGSPKSQHLLGKAVDIKVTGMSPKAVALSAFNCGFRGIGVYRHNGDRFVHCDIRAGTPSYWKDNPGTKTLTAVRDLSTV